MNATPAPFMLLFRNTGPENIAHLNSSERDDLIKRWNAWYDELVAQGKALGGSPLTDETRVVSGRGGARVVDGPFAESKEAIGGYVLVLASDFAEATAIAQRHPGLEYGFLLEVRQLNAHCHLGISAKSAPAAPATPAVA